MKKNNRLIAGFVLTLFLMMGTMAWAQIEPTGKPAKIIGVDAVIGDSAKLDVSTAKIAKIEARKVALENRRMAFVKIRDEIRAVQKITNETERNRARAKLSEEVAVRQGFEITTLSALRLKANLTQADREAIDVAILKVHRENLSVNVERVLDRAEKIDARITDMLARLRVRVNDTTDASEKARLEAALDKLVALQVRVQSYINDIQSDQSILDDGSASTEELRSMQRRMIELRVFMKRLTEGVRTFVERVPRRGESNEVRPALSEEVIAVVEVAVEAPTPAELSVEVEEAMVVAPIAEVDPTTGGDQ